MSSSFKTRHDITGFTEIYIHSNPVLMNFLFHSPPQTHASLNLADFSRLFGSLAVVCDCFAEINPFFSTFVFFCVFFLRVLSILWSAIGRKFFSSWSFFHSCPSIRIRSTGRESVFEFDPFLCLQCSAVVGKSDQSRSQAWQPSHPERLDVHPQPWDHEGWQSRLLVRPNLRERVMVQRWRG